MPQIVLIFIILTSTALYITRRLPTEITATLTITSLIFTGILSPEQAFSGFSNPATLTVAAMFVLSAGLIRTGSLETVSLHLARYAGRSPTQLLLILGLLIPTASAFMNNTPIVVMMIPIVLSLCRRLGLSSSRLLLPVAYFATLGGTITLLGTSTNILVDNLYRAAGGPGLGLFTFTPLGLIYALLGVLFLVTVGQRLLPDRTPVLGLTAQQGDAIYVTEIVLGPLSSLIGKPAAHAFQMEPSRRRALPGHLQPTRRRVGLPAGASTEKTHERPPLELLEIFHGQTTVPAQEAGRHILTAGDSLLIAGTPKEIARFIDTTGTELASVLEDDRRVPMRSLQQKMVEALVVPDSPFNGRALAALELHRLYGVSILGVQRQESRYRSGLRQLRLEGGDVLLLQGQAVGLTAASQAGKLILIEGIDQTIVRADRNRTALLIMAGVVLLATLSPLPVAVLALAGAALMVITRCLQLDEAVGALNPSTLMLLAGTIPLGVAMQSTGLAQFMVDRLLALVGTQNPVVLISIFYLVTSLLTELISNNAVAVLMTPIALQLAASLGISPVPLLMAVSFGASASFMTPIGYQTNAIVMGPGGYTFRDYLRLGAPLQLLMWIVATLFIPILYRI